MPRIREVTMDGITVKISPFSYDETEKYVLEGKEMLARQPAPPTEEWTTRSLKSVAFALNKADGKETWTVEKVRQEYDMVLINFIYEEFMKMSGLMSVTPPQGEALATSTSR